MPVDQIHDLTKSRKKDDLSIFQKWIQKKEQDELEKLKKIEEEKKLQKEKEEKEKEAAA